MKLKDQTAITDKVRLKVYERDSFEDCPCCIWCGYPKNVEVHHYIERSRGGLGIEENLVCLCPVCHKAVHNGNRQIEQFIGEYLSSKYEGWEEKALIARKE